MRWIFLAGVFSLASCNPRVMVVIPSSLELTRQPGGTWVKSVREKPRQKQVQIEDQAGRIQRVPLDLVWGYRTGQGHVYRLYEHSWYRVLQQGSLVIYHLKAWLFHSSWDRYYFSLTPDGELYQLTKPNCQDVFRSDSCMLSLLSHMGNLQLISRDSHHSYGLENAYQYCHVRRR